ncbi:PQQ-binding-like beta-propeller repeat protein [Cryptosporangium minutisporangium]|uniref:outer membrane protein assembly factor BamB family protein n=1 Tax=Cryptosporangium minutisporangium TaxID=113569 RepID=UPI0031EC12EC
MPGAQVSAPISSRRRSSTDRVVAMLQRSDQTVIAVGLDAVCAGSGYGFVVLDRDSGEELWSTTESRGDLVPGPVTSDDAVFVSQGAGEDSVIQAWQLRDGKPLRTQKGLSIGVHLQVVEEMLIASTFREIHAYPLPLN